MTEPHVHISASPHIHSKKSKSIQEIMLYVIIALLPTTIWGIVAFGYKAVIVVLLSVFVSVLTEFLIDKFIKKDISSLKDLSAIVTGMLVGLNLSSEVPLYIPIIASVFAIAVCKMSFGGIGQNIANPAIGGRLFVMFSFTSAMGNYAVPRFLRGLESVPLMSAATSMATSSATSIATSSATSMASSATVAVTSATTSSATISSQLLLSGATPLSYVKALPESGLSAIKALESAGYPFTGFAEKVGSALHISPYYVDAFIGNISGCIGEVSAFLLIIGGIFLLIKKVISYHIPLSYLLTFGIFTWLFGGIPQGLGMFHGDAFWGIITGGVILGSLFMATDMVTTPITHKGQVIFGIGCGFLTFFFRTFASLSEGASIAILMMNIATPLIDKYTHPRVMGTPYRGFSAKFHNRSKSTEVTK